MHERIRPGAPSPLGATPDGDGVNFALFSENATAVELCLFDPDDPARETGCLTLPERTGFVWHGYVPDVSPGQLYGYRVHGPYDPEAGHRFNPAKLLIDPYAKAIAGEVDWNEPVHGFDPGHLDGHLSRCDRDSARGVPKGLVVDPHFDWENDTLPRTPLNQSIIYEVHVRGFTQQHPGIPDEIRGTYAGLAHPKSVEYLASLGITAVELLPIHDMLNDERLTKLGLANYWGYNTTNFFAPAARYASAGERGGQVTEFREMVKTLHRSGIEVILDVVYNHTSEGNENGPTLSFRGLDNATYYVLDEEDPSEYIDVTGTGNTVRAHHPQVLKLIMDSLRYWVQEMHVDGFRFDLTTTLARNGDDLAFEKMSAFLNAIHQDPVLSQVKLIAEPWDLGEDGYQVGGFPVDWSEWNGKYRDTIRSFWRGDSDQLAEFASRLSGSSDLYQDNGRSPLASINFVTAHDGYTLHDLVTYEQKYNHANGERNRDGSSWNISWNSGMEGETNDPDIIELRERRKRTFLATLLLSQGVPMILGGDEISRTQHGNNNAYAQDNEISWFDWELDERKESLLNFTRRLIELRKNHPNLRRRTFFHGKPVNGSDALDISWLKFDGSHVTGEDFHDANNKTLGILMAGNAIDELDEHGNIVADDTLLILVNQRRNARLASLPEMTSGSSWQVLLDTNRPETGVRHPGETLTPDDKVRVAGLSLVLLKLVE